MGFTVTGKPVGRKPRREYIPIREARKRLRCSTKDVETWIVSGRLRWVRRGLAVLVCVEDVEKVRR